MNGAVNKQDGKDIDGAFSTKRDQYYDFNKTLEDSKKNTKDKSVPDDAKDHTKDTANMFDEDKKSEKKDREGVRVYRIPIAPKPKKNVKDTNKVDATPKVKEAKDADELELGAEASTIKKDDKDDKEEEDEVIEVFDWWPLWMSRRSVYSACIVLVISSFRHFLPVVVHLE